MKPLKRTLGIETSDGKRFGLEDKAAALTHEAGIAIRGIVNRNGIGKMPSISPEAVVSFIVGHASEILPELRAYRDAVQRATPRAK